MHKHSVAMISICSGKMASQHIHVEVFFKLESLARLSAGL